MASYRRISSKKATRGLVLRAALWHCHPRCDRDVTYAIVIRSLWLSLPLFALLELVLHFHFALAPPTLEEWRSLRGRVEALLDDQKGLVVVAPTWAEPQARSALGEELMPLRDVARAEVHGHTRAVEISILDQTASELDGWSIEETVEHGPFVLRLRTNPEPAPVRFDFIEALGSPGVSASVMRDGERQECVYKTSQRTRTGHGIGGHPTIPESRFDCGGEAFVGVTVMEDQRYEPVRCLWFSPGDASRIGVRFPSVPAGSEISGFHGLAWLAERGRGKREAGLEIRQGDQTMARFPHDDGEGMKPFALPFPGSEPVALEFWVRATGKRRWYCVTAKVH